MKPTTCFLDACYVSTSIQSKQVRVMLNFLVKKPWVRMFPYCKTLKLFIIHFLLSISTCGDSASDFLDMKMLIDSVTYLKQHV